MIKPVVAKLAYRSFAGCGVDVAINRADDLDKRLLEYLKTKANPSVLDLGCGAGGQSLRMVKLGAEVVAVDKHDFSNEFERYRQAENISEGRLKFVCSNMVELSKLISTKNFTAACVQRTLHYLSYNEALELLKYLYEIIEDRLYISVTGVTSEIGADYRGKNIPIENRFLALNPDRAETFSIHEPVCLYSEPEFLHLLKISGWKIDWYRQSDFGNLKAVCIH